MIELFVVPGIQSGCCGSTASCEIDSSQEINYVRW